MTYELEDAILFELADPRHPSFSLEEYDLYTNHESRLSLRKNLGTNEWEFFKHFYASPQEDKVIWKSKDWPKILTHLKKLLADWHKLQRQAEQRGYAESELKHIFGMK